MAQTIQSGIVDLTGEDDNDDSIARANAACEKAFKAASRLTDHFESLKTYKNPNDLVDLGEEVPLPAIASKPLVPFRFGSFPNSTEFESGGIKQDERDNAVPRQDSLVPSSNASIPQSLLGIASSKPAKSTSYLKRVEGNKRRPKDTVYVTPEVNISTIRTPRSAAVSAKQNIAENCNELEEWVSKDPNLMPQQVGGGAPRKPGRAKRDPDEWSPNSSTKDNVEERKGLSKISTQPSTPSAGKHEDMTLHKSRSLSPIKAISTPLDTKKRKFSGSHQQHDYPLKLARLSGKPNAYHEPNPPNLAKPANSEHVIDRAEQTPPGDCFPRCVYPAIKSAKAEYKQTLSDDDLTNIEKTIINDILEQGVETFWPISANCPENQRTELISKSVSEAFHERAIKILASVGFSLKDGTAPLFERDPKVSQIKGDPSSKSTLEMNSDSLSKPSTVDFAKTGASIKPKKLDTQEKIDSRLRENLHKASTPEPEMYSASIGPVVFATLFESVVYPAMKKSKKRHKDSLPQEGLDAIGNTIVDEVLKRLASHAEVSHQLDEDTKKKIKHFVKKSFRQKVRKANAQVSHKSATPAHNASSQANGVKQEEDAQAPDETPPGSLYRQQSLSLQISPNESPSSPFDPNFDRGRYPAQRRRRGNKYFTPTKTAKTTAMLKQDHFIPPDDHLRSQPVTGLFHNPTSTVPTSKKHKNPGISNGKDQVRLLKNLANQPTISRAGEKQLTVSATATEKKKSLTNSESALELLASVKESTDIRPVAAKSASCGNVSKELRQALMQGQRRMIDVTETPTDGCRPIFSHLAKSRNNNTADQPAQKILGKRPLEDSGSREKPRPILYPKPATAFDPSLEHVVAVLVTDTSKWPSNDAQGYSITRKNRMQLVNSQSIIKHLDLSSKPGKPTFVRMETKVIDPIRDSRRCISSLLRNRELGLSYRGRHVGTLNELHQLKSEMIEPWKNWKGASGDVVAVAWSPNSNVYAFGAAAHTNIEDIQYNRPCNLLLGDLTSNQIRELPDHRIDRPKPETISNGPNASQAVYDACDANVYETVTSIAFSSTGDRMFTASHDCTVKIWDVSVGNHKCLSTLRHEAWVTSVEISEHRQGLIATASKCVKDAVRIYYDPAEPSCYVNFSASRAETRPNWKMYPECLRWGPNPSNSHLLLAGFQQWEQQEDLLSSGGQLCLWDANTSESIKVTPSSQSVYAAAWHPTEPFFATGGAPGNNISDKINTKTVVRTWDIRVPKRCHVEYECPAIDMQDITFSPLNPNIVTAGCTDGISYVWDWRWPDQPLHCLKHGGPLVDLDHTRKREEADTGVMLSLWGPSGTLFYTGSSDGIIKAWDVRRHPKDVLISNVANFDVSIQSGAFSPDGNNLLVGDAEGGIHVLSSAPCWPRSNVGSTDAYIDLVRASDGSGLQFDQIDDNPGTEGIEAANSLVESGQLEYHKELGIGQGSNYNGPYAAYARKETAGSIIGRLRKKFEKKQPISKRGEKRWDIAIPMTSLLDERKESLKRKKNSDKMAVDEVNGHEPKPLHRPKGGESIRTSLFFSTPEGTSAVGHPSPTSQVGCIASKVTGATVADGHEDQTVEYNTISESEMVEENFWWEMMGKKEINEARAGRR